MTVRGGRENAAAGRAPSTETVHLAVGRWSPSIGGPYQTVLSYRTILSTKLNVRIVGLATVAGHDNSDDVGLRLIDGGWRVWHRVFAYCWRARKDHTVVFGVWHPVFFARALVQFIGGSKRPGRLVLVPTQSLSDWDWAKHRIVKALLRPVVSLALGRVDVIIFATEGERAMSNPAVPATKSIVIYHPIEPIEQHGDASAAVDVLRLRIAFLGRLAQEKDLDLFLDVLARLPDDWTADIVGEGDDDYRAALVRHAAAIGGTARLRWHGWLPRNDAHRVISGAAALVVTSHAENYCHASVEAMALGVPVVMVSRVAAAIDLRLNKTGIVVPADAEALASAIVSIQRDDTGQRDEMLSRARGFAEARASGADTEMLLAVVTGD